MPMLAAADLVLGSDVRNKQLSSARALEVVLYKVVVGTYLVWLLVSLCG